MEDRVWVRWPISCMRACFGIVVDDLCYHESPGFCYFILDVNFYDLQTYLHNQKNETQQYNNHHDTDFQAMQNVF